MNPFNSMIEKARDTMSVRRVYGEPYEKDGLVVIPAAAVRGGAGGGTGDAGEAGGEGSGGGFGMTGRPVGAYQIKDGEVTWIPAADTTRVIVLSQVVAIVGLLVLRSIIKIRSKVGE